jgi:methionyl-tRNA synthetase
LIKPRSRINGETPKFVETEHYFLDLPAFANALGAWLQSKSGQWRPNVLKFALNLLNDLKPRAITRDLDWGVPVPLDGWRDRPDKRIYVWFDAVIGYLSASIEWAARSGDPDAWRAWWQREDADSYYFMGKDNIVFHAEIWPALLMGYCGRGDKGGTPGKYGVLNLPTEVVSSEFLTMEAQKFSSSRGVGILVRDFMSRYDADALRYYLCAAGPETSDTDFTWSGVPASQQRRTSRGLGQPGQSLGVDGGEELRRHPGAAELTDADRDLLSTTQAASAQLATCSRPRTRRPHSTSRCVWSRRPASTSRPGPVEATRV